MKSLVTVYHKNRKRKIDWLKASSHYFDLDGELKLTVLHPAILNIAGGVAGKSILDFGCGDGSLSEHLAQKGGIVHAVDKSKKILKRAKLRHPEKHGLKFDPVETPYYTAVRDHEKYDLVIVSLVLVTIASEREAEEVIDVLSAVIQDSGRLILGETHPCFQDRMFSTFDMHLDVEHKYSEKGCPFQVKVFDGYHPQDFVEFTDFHRPLERLFELLRRGGFAVTQFLELYDKVRSERQPSEIVSRQNPFVPPYICIEAIKL